MSGLQIEVPPEYDPGTGWGFYRTRDMGRWKILQYVDTPDWKINDVVVFAFSSRKGEWWIGADYTDERPFMDLIGPYDTAEQTVCMIKLLGTPRK
jgi:hypothetical protein